MHPRAIDRRFHAEPKISRGGKKHTDEFITTGHPLTHARLTHTHLSPRDISLGVAPATHATKCHSLKKT